MSEQNFPDFIVAIKKNKKSYWCMTTTTIKPYDLDESRIILVNDKIDFGNLKKFIKDTASCFCGNFFVGSISIFFDSEQDINILRIKYPEINV